MRCKCHLFLILGLLGLLVAGATGPVCSPTQPEDPVCVEPIDCEGLPHLACPGEWNCTQGACAWQCLPTGPVYTLHEWGVFKTYGDGAEVSTAPGPYIGAIPAKPILYFYSDEDFEIDVSIDFASGTATETWPEIPLLQSISWPAVSITNGACNTTPFPVVDWGAMGEDWIAPEVTQLGPLVVDDASCLSFEDTISKLLFYTGELPEFAPPLEVQYQLDPATSILQLAVSNLSQRPVGKVMVVLRLVDSDCIDPSGCWIHYAALSHGVLDGVLPGGSVTAEFPVVELSSETSEIYTPPQPPEDWLAQGATLGQHIQDLGLTADEAAAFMSAWDKIFFGVMSSASMFSQPEYENGLFLIYALPEEAYDEELALTTSVPPAELVRVGVVHQAIPEQSCWAGQELSGSECICPEIDFGCSPWCDPADPICKPGTWNDLTCACDPVDPNYW